jgi:hypothetical protein
LREPVPVDLGIELAGLSHEDLIVRREAYRRSVAANDGQPT